jgi:hypothetical protein
MNLCAVSSKYVRRLSGDRDLTSGHGSVWRVMQTQLIMEMIPQQRGGKEKPRLDDTEEPEKELDRGAQFIGKRDMPSSMQSFSAGMVGPSLNMQ